MGDVIISAVIIITGNYPGDVPSVSGASVSDGDNLGLLVTATNKIYNDPPSPSPARQVSRCETRPPLLDSSVADWWLRCEHLQWQQQQCDDIC